LESRRVSADLGRGLVGLVVVPPVSLILAVLLGGLVALRGARIGAWTAVLAAALLLALSTRLVSGLLLASLESPAVPVGAPPPAAILVLGAETRTGPDGADVGPLTLERLRRAADLRRETGLPLLVTGGVTTTGVTTTGAPPLAELMREVLENSFRVQVRWVEPAALNTFENATRSAAILAPEGIASVLLVTHPWHMRRARAELGHAGLVAWPAPVRAQRIPNGRPDDWIPRPDHLAMSWFALREWAGLLAQQMGI
jgi:uncharacterized SAM-binding protein YcdF (DUF218 family)